MKFWQLTQAHWGEVLYALSRVFDFNEPARCLVNDESTPHAEISIGEDLELCRKHHSPRLRSYMLSAAEVIDEPVLGRCLCEDSQPLRPGDHPLPA